ncbi:MAG: class II D-tagatose-bisphosphate aldolase, non-catalytic subunit [Actinomycetia bacterium]|nr:class II D-tagatose-bisphosphate aldolase, non-catalytic subunit [Actinomycetes bacterium]
MTEHALDVLAAAHRAGRPDGLASICSAHPLVLDETVRHGVDGEHVVLIEATCNQVNQDGGYTGMQPVEFLNQVVALAERSGLPAERLVLGGDHLGPNPWKHLSAATAMAKSEELVAAFVTAGYSKIHLDTSARCADDPPGALAPALVAERAARLAAVAERAATAPGVQLRYVIGTEVPVPGGESTGEHGIHVSTADDVAETIEVTQLAFTSVGEADAWRRVRAVVAQPGVEFSDEELYAYAPGQASHLAQCLDGDVPLVFEAHSTDYQSWQSLRGLVADHFAILKVGPGLTFAYREALFGLSFIEDELLDAEASGVRAVLDAAMVAEPEYWKPFYPNDPERAAQARRYSRSDRSRYYWPVPSVQRAVGELRRNLESKGLPDELVSQFLPWLSPQEVPGSASVGSGASGLTPDIVLRAAIRQVLDAYTSAT